MARTPSSIDAFDGALRKEVSGVFLPAVVCVNQGMRIGLEDGYQIRKWREEECFIKARAKRACVFIKRAPTYKNKLLWFHAARRYHAAPALSACC